jgi:hypothetical protein
MKRLSCSSDSKQSQQSRIASADQTINNLLKKQALLCKAPYVQAIDRSKIDPIAELERRVMKRLKPRYSLEAFKELQKVMQSMTALDRVDYLHKLQDKLNGIKTKNNSRRI